MSLEEKSISTKKESWNNFIKSAWISSQLFDESDPINEALTLLSYDVLLNMITKKIFTYIFHDVESVTVLGIEYPFMNESSKIFIIIFFLLVILILQTQNYYKLFLTL